MGGRDEEKNKQIATIREKARAEAERRKEEKRRKEIKMVREEAAKSDVANLDKGKESQARRDEIRAEAKKKAKKEEKKKKNRRRGQI